VTRKPFFREPFKKKRCLMPVSGYYEWEDTSDGKQPYYFTARDGSPMLTIAGCGMNGRIERQASASSHAR
jgi:putative SOS response-associated peptidase YedK